MSQTRDLAPTAEEVATVENFVRQLELEPAGEDRFIGRAEREHPEWNRVFGGLVLGQAAIAAGRTAPDPSLHSLHAYFLRGGRPDVPIEYRVERVRDGRTFTSRRVLASQEGVPICDTTMSFAHHEDGISHQESMPDVPPPESLRDARIEYPMDDGSTWPLGPVEWRVFEPFDKIARPGELASVREWFRFRAALPHDPVLHAAALVFCSDMGSLNGVERRYGWEGMSHHASASLDHGFWLHRPARLEGWFLMVTDTPVANAARAWTQRQFYARDGTHVATMVQEAVVRRERR